MTPDLRRLARAHSVQTAYYGLGGVRHEPSSDALLAIFQSLGVPIRNPSEAGIALARRQAEDWQRFLEPVAVGSEAGGMVDVRLPTDAASHLECTLRLESGEEHSWAAAWAECIALEHGAIRRKLYQRRGLAVRGPLPLGYHQLTVITGSFKADTLLIVPPRRAFAPGRPGRTWGVFGPAYALHSQHSWGAGDLSDLDELTTWVSGLEGTVVGTTPLLATFDSDPFEPSPYSPVSRLFWNEMYLDIDRVLAQARSYAAGAPEPHELNGTLESLKRAELIDYSGLIRLRRAVLEPLAEQFFRGPPAARREYEAYVANHPLVREYARFRALREQFGDRWPHVADRLRPGERLDSSQRQVLNYHQYVQWLTHQRLSETTTAAKTRGVGLYFDLPVGVRRDGFDPWLERDLFAAHASVGAPPDPGFPSGQNWLLPPVRPEASRLQGHRYFIQSIRHQLQFASILRIDHVMGLHRLFWIPPGGDSRDGAYVRYPAEEYYAILKLEAHRHQARIVGEDLGIVPREVRSAMGRHGLQRLYVLQFELLSSSDRPTGDPPVDSVASLNTHDMAPFAAALAHPQENPFWPQLIRLLRERGLIEADHFDVETVLAACYRLLGNSPARVVLANLEDLWLETAPQNVPGPDFGNPNWRRKLRYSLEEIRALPKVESLLRTLAAARHS